MNLKQSALAAAVTATLALGAAGQASAYVYGAAGLTINNLVVHFRSSASYRNPFDFTLSNVATLNGASVA